MRWLVALFAMGACGDSGQNGQHPDAAIDTITIDLPPDADPNNPATLMDTGLCIDAACTQIASGVHAYAPRFQLWSDTATKRRWIYLPPGTKIDTTDPDYWQFPVGTKLWKEFTRDGVRVETRLLMRIGAGDTVNDWFFMPYVWNQTQDATTAEPYGVVDANGTQHDVPGRAQCKTCHDNVRPSRVLGFSAVQLDYDNPTAGEYDLAELVAQGLLTVAPLGSGSAGAPFYPLPGDTTYQQPALGYMHANCGHCHNPTSNVYMSGQAVIELRLTVGTLGQLSATPPYATAVNQNAVTPIGGFTKIVNPNMPDQSIMIYRFESTVSTVHMPALGAEITDSTGDTTLRNWITHL